MQTATEQIFEICSRHTEQRGTHNMSFPNDFAQATHLLYDAQRIVIVTGFTIAACGIGETDGPSGSIALASALEKLGKQVLIITDSYSEIILKSLITVMNLKAPLLIRRNEQCEAEFLSLWDTFKPDLLVGLERPGRTESGKVFSMHALDITSFCPDTDFLFYHARNHNIPTVCIGDGGNEVGMGKVKDLIIKQVPLGETIVAAFSADVLLSCGVSNWGGIGLVGLLSLLSESNLLHEDDQEEAMIQAMADSGAVDGVLKKVGTTIDGFSLEENLQILKDVRKVVMAHLGKTLE